MKSYLSQKIEKLKTQNLYRSLKTIDSDQGPEVIFQGEKYLNFSSNNYLGLANHPLLIEASIKATKEFGTGSGASRLITGSMSLHEELEKKIAAFKGVEAALVFNSGYHANLGIIPALMGQDDVVFSDELNHASLIDGTRLAKAKTHVYRHNDVGHLEELMRDLPPPAPPYKGGETPPLCKGRLGGVDHEQRLILTDSVFSMDGDLCPLPEIIKLAEKYNAWVLVDEAHATGVFGERGRGVVEHSKIDSNHPRLIQMGTLGKALGSFGAYVCGPKELIDFLINRSRTFIYTTALPPSVLAASLAAIDLISEDGSLKNQLWENVEYFKNGLEKILASRGTACCAPTDSPIIPIIIGDTAKTMDVANKLFEKGIWATGIRPPTVPEGTSRIRLTLMATHTKEHLDRCLNVIADCGLQISD